MKKLKAILLVCVLAGLTGCGCTFATDCGNEDEKLPAYTNKSGVTVKIVASRNYEKFIAENDTLHYYNSEEWYIPHDWNCGLVTTSYCDDPIRMELYFLDNPEKCLIFDGPIKHDGIDMRSWKSYKRGKEIENWADFWLGVEYVYAITPEHRAMAKEENCPPGRAAHKGWVPGG